MKGISVNYVNNKNGFDNEDKIHISLELPQELFSLLISKLSIKREIVFGEFPNPNIPVDEATAKSLDEFYDIFNARRENRKGGSIQLTGRTFSEEENVIMTRHSTRNPEYSHEYVRHANKKYREYIFQNRKFICKEKGKKRTWIEVLPIVWIVDLEKNTITTKDPIINNILKTYMYDASTWADGLYFLRILKESKEKTLAYAQKIASEILKTANLTKTIKYSNYKDLLAILYNNNNYASFEGIVTITFEGPKLTPEETEEIKKLLGNNTYSFNEAKEKDSEPNRKINDIVDKIYSLLDLGLYDNQEKVKNKINELINEYNKQIKSNSTELLSIERHDVSYLYSKLTKDLEDILNKLLSVVDSHKEYVEMLMLTNNCIHILETSEGVIISNDLERDLVSIKEGVFPYFKDTDKPNELISIFKNERERIISYIKGNNTSKAKDYGTLANYIMIIRRKLQKYLVSARLDIRNRDVVKETINLYKKIIEGQNAKSKDQHINYFLKEIERNKEIINVFGTQAERDALTALLGSVEIKDNYSLQTTISLLSSLLMNIYKIVYDIEKRKAIKSEIDDYTVKLHDK